MQVAISGASGLLGRALSASLKTDGIQVRPLVRQPVDHAEQIDQADAIAWDPMQNQIDGAQLDGVDAVVHLAGAGIADRRWSARQKYAILTSRTRGTELLARTLAQLDNPPSVLVSGSAIGYYGDRAAQVLTETDEPGDGFLSEVVAAWEDSTRAATDAGIRVAHSRTGLVLSRSGGLLKTMLLPFRLGIGGRLGPGTQWMSWISRPDMVRALRHLIDTDSLSGPVNMTAPHPVTNHDFTKALGRAVRRPTVLPTPLLPLKLTRGRELVDEMMLASQYVDSTRLQQAGFTFDHATIEAGLTAALED